MEKAELNDVSDTAFWVAAYRAQESERSDALFHDPLARVLAGEKGRKILQQMGPSPQTAWSLALRTKVIDEYIQELVERREIDAVINLGAGLDTRPYRLKLPSNLKWIEVDDALLIEYKTEKLRPHKSSCELERFSMDLADSGQRSQFFRQMQNRGLRTLVLTEGVLPYLTEEQVAALAADLRGHSTFQFWIVDYYSPKIVPLINSRQRQHQMRNTPFRFFPQEGFRFYGRFGWKVNEVRYLGEEAAKRGRAFPLPAFVRFLLLLNPQRKADMKRSMGYVLLEASSIN